MIQLPKQQEVDINKIKNIVPIKQFVEIPVVDYPKWFKDKKRANDDKK